MGGVAASSPLVEETQPESNDRHLETNNTENRSNKSENEATPESNEGGEGGDTTNDELADRPGLIRDDGTINWDCPCLGGMAYGPCGTEFRAAFSCFHYSTAEQKGSDCLEPFMAMQECFRKYPEIFGPKEGEEGFEEMDDDETEHLKKDIKDGKSDSDRGQLSESEKTSVQIK